MGSRLSDMFLVCLVTMCGTSLLRIILPQYGVWRRLYVGIVEKDARVTSIQRNSASPSLTRQGSC